MNSKGPYPSSEREIKFRRYLFTFSIKHEITHFHVVVVQKRQEKCKNVWCRCKIVVLLIKVIVFFDVLVAVALLDLKVPYKYWERAGQILAFLFPVISNSPKSSRKLSRPNSLIDA